MTAPFPKNFDSLHTLIKDYRDARKILLGMEVRLLIPAAGNWEDLPIDQKMKVFSVLKHLSCDADGIERRKADFGAGP